jgi:carbon monoxide dehydrogenase subunit G
VQLEHSFSIPIGVEEAWGLLLDIGRVAHCMPGAAIETIEGDEFTGSVKVKLGPVSLLYKGQASFLEKDEANHRVVIQARGRDSRGNGTAAARVVAILDRDGKSTSVRVETELDITGKPAQFGRGVMIDVGNTLLGRFAENLALQLSDTTAVQSSAALGPPAAGIPTTGSLPPPAERADASSEAHVADPEPINLLSTAGPALVKRLVPPALVLLTLLALRYLRPRLGKA